MPPKKVKNKYGFMVNVSHPSHPHSPPSDKSITTSPKRRAPQTATEPIARPAKQSKPSSYTVSQAPSPARVYNTINRLGTTLDGARHPSSLAIMKGGVATGKDMPQKSRKGLGESDAEARYLFTCKAPRSDSFDEPTIKEEIPKLPSPLTRHFTSISLEDGQCNDQTNILGSENGSEMRGETPQLLHDLRLYRAGEINFQPKSPSLPSPSSGITVNPLKNPEALSSNLHFAQPSNTASDPKSTVASTLHPPGVSSVKFPELTSTAHFAASRLGQQHRSKIPTRSNASVAKIPTKIDSPTATLRIELPAQNTLEITITAQVFPGNEQVKDGSVAENHSAHDVYVGTSNNMQAGGAMHPSVGMPASHASNAITGERLHMSSQRPDDGTVTIVQPTSIVTHLSFIGTSSDQSVWPAAKAQPRKSSIHQPDRAGSGHVSPVRMCQDKGDFRVPTTLPETMPSNNVTYAAIQSAAKERPRMSMPEADSGSQYPSQPGIVLQERNSVMDGNLIPTAPTETTSSSIARATANNFRDANRPGLCDVSRDFLCSHTSNLQHGDSTSLVQSRSAIEPNDTGLSDTTRNSYFATPHSPAPVKPPNPTSTAISLRQKTPFARGNKEVIVIEDDDDDASSTITVIPPTKKASATTASAPKPPNRFKTPATRLAPPNTITPLRIKNFTTAASRVTKRKATRATKPAPLFAEPIKSKGIKLDRLERFWLTLGALYEEKQLFRGSRIYLSGAGRCRYDDFDNCIEKVNEAIKGKYREFKKREGASALFELQNQRMVWLSGVENSRVLFSRDAVARLGQG